MPHLRHGLQKSPDSLFNCQRPRRLSAAASGHPAVRVSPEELPHPVWPVNLFFQLSSRRRFAPTVSRSPACGVGLSSPSRPARQHLFSTSPRPRSRAFPTRAALRLPARGVGLSTRPRQSRQHLFSTCLRGACALRTGSRFPAPESSYLPAPAVPVNTFFQLFPERQSKAFCGSRT